MKRFHVKPDHVRLIASLAFNFIAKVPGIAAVFVILPMVSRSLGTADYGELLSALALGSVFTLPFGGINAVGRRLLGAAVGAGDRAEQANVFMTTVVSMGIVALGAAALMIGVSAGSWARPTFILVSTLPLLAGFCNVFDNTRASFNEHYVTALCQLAFQTTVYAGVYLVGLPKSGVITAGLTMQAPFILASLMTLVLLLIQRPYLHAGHVANMRSMVFPALGVMMADGALAVMLNLSVYWLTASHNAGMAAWDGTFIRLFQSFMSPVLLILFPVTTYISMRWQSMSRPRQALMYKLFLLLGFSYGCVVGGAMALAGPWYIDRMFKLSVHGDRVDVLALSLFMGAVITQKAFTMLIYAVAEARFISFGTALVAALGVCAAALSRIWLSDVGVIDVLFIVIGLALPVVLLIGWFRYRQTGNRGSIAEVG